MLEQIKKEIELSNELISSLPQKTNKNKEYYIETVDQEIEKYKKLENEIYSQLEKRIEPYKNLKYIEQDNNEETLEALSKALIYTSNLATPYEKLKIDKIIYQLTNYQSNNLNYNNKNILKLIKTYQKAGVQLTEKDFNYTKYVSKYMTIFFQNIDSLENITLKEQFEQIYWQCPKLIDQIQLNLRHIYLKYQKQLTKYIEEQIKKINSSFKNGEQTVIDDYNYLLKKKKQFSPKTNLILDFYNQKKDIEEYTDEKIEPIIQNIFTEDFGLDKIKTTEKLLNSLEEYQNYLKYKPLLEQIKKLHEEKLEDKYLEKNLKKIATLENKLFKLNKKESKTIKKTSVSKVEPDINQVLEEIKTIYEEIDNTIFTVIIKKQIMNNSTIFKALLLASRYYTPIANYLKQEDTTYIQIDKQIKELENFIFDSDNILISTTPLLQEIDLAQTIVSNYKLLNLNIDLSMLEEGNIETQIESLKKILINNQIKTQDISIQKLKNIKEIQAIEKKRV